MSRDGCADGCASSMRSAAADVIGSRTSTCTIRWDWFASETSCTTFRGRTLEYLVREPSAGNPLARFDAAGCGNGVMAPRLRHRHPKGAATVERGLPLPRHISTLRCPARTGQDRERPSSSMAVADLNGGRFLRGTLRLLWHVLRLPVFMFLAILEPVVSFVLGALALLGVLTALFFKFYGVPHFPFALMLGVSVGFGLMQAGYYALLRLFGR